ncbi:MULTISPECIES: thioesterase II family protein [Streptomyces]|uniref:thioesterase II family protein n=1 Tax=Streptomyces TaxID=1883 RepID=UPI00068F983A|nr:MULTISPECIES: alpha/beta fold hydrolase [Streptomyces]
MTVTSLPSTAAAWLRVLHAPERPLHRLVCFPHAGGAASFFRAWPALLGPDTEVLAVRYPGREDRILEGPARTMDDLSGPVAAALAALPPLPTVYFGHSMGASVAYEVARETAPRLLLVSGRAAPHRLPRFRYDDDAALLADVRRRGGPLAPALDDPDLVELVLPALRADYALLEDYAAKARAERLDLPVAAFYGEADPDVPADAVLAWADVAARGAFTSRAFPGDHFYLVPHAAEVTGDITAHLSALSVPMARRNT